MNDFAHTISNTGEVVGTPKYMAPEQLQGNTDPRSDIYSLGLTLYELAAERPTQTMGNSVPQIRDIREVNPIIPEDLAHVIMKACSFLPEERYETALELETVLRRFYQR